MELLSLIAPLEGKISPAPFVASVFWAAAQLLHIPLSSEMAVGRRWLSRMNVWLSNWNSLSNEFLKILIVFRHTCMQVELLWCPFRDQSFLSETTTWRTCCKWQGNKETNYCSGVCCVWSLLERSELTRKPFPYEAVGYSKVKVVQDL